MEKYKPSGGKKNNHQIPNLTTLADALESPESSPEKFKEFISASSRTTNDEKRRTKIFRWLCKAIELEKI